MSLFKQLQNRFNKRHHYFEEVTEEIALEGLDGITLQGWLIFLGFMVYLFFSVNKVFCPFVLPL